MGATHFAPATRAMEEEIERELRAVAGSPVVAAILDSFDGYFMVLNGHRQVLAANQRVAEELVVDELEVALGARPGELVDCINARSMSGCGTTRACSTCGAVITILASQRDQEVSTGECQLTVQRGDHQESFEFRVRATPVDIEGHTYTLFVLRDIADERRREVLERAFLHDLLNTIGGLTGWGQLLSDLDQDASQKAAGRISVLSQRLLREVRNHHALLEAERGDLALNLQSVSVSEVLDGLATLFAEHGAAVGKSLELAPCRDGQLIDTDVTLLLRVLTNMVINAFEASPPGAVVRVAYRGERQSRFEVWNAGEIPERVALQIFRRSFTTKSGGGHGLGSYGMKLFGERYLRGKVGFSTGAAGTTFFIDLARADQGGRAVADIQCGVKPRVSLRHRNSFLTRPS